MNQQLKTLYAIAVFFLLLGGVFFSLGAFGVVQGRAAWGWRKSVGVVNSVEEVHSPGKVGTVASVQVLYSYKQGDESYVGDAIAFGGAGRARTEGLKNRIGREVTVWVNPKNPAEAVLFPGVGALAIAFVTLGSMGIGAAGLVVVFGRREYGTPTD